MNPDSGHLKKFATLDDFDRALREGYEPVPAHLGHAARRKLAGKSEAMVSLTSGGKLSKWAAGKRKKRRQMAKAARRANRHQGGK